MSGDIPQSLMVTEEGKNSSKTQLRIEFQDRIKYEDVLGKTISFPDSSEEKTQNEARSRDNEEEYHQC